MTLGERHTSPGRRLSYWIGDVLRDHRTAAGVSDKTMAAALDMDVRKIRRLEGGEGETTQTYHNIDRAVWAYAHVLGIEDPRDLWDEALARWRKCGATPDFADELPEAMRITPVRPAEPDVAARIAAEVPPPPSDLPTRKSRKPNDGARARRQNGPAA